MKLKFRTACYFNYLDHFICKDAILTGFIPLLRGGIFIFFCEPAN
jgi:hypothetical protein